MFFGAVELSYLWEGDREVLQRGSSERFSMVCLTSAWAQKLSLFVRLISDMALVFWYTEPCEMTCPFNSSSTIYTDSDLMFHAQLYTDAGYPTAKQSYVRIQRVVTCAFQSTKTCFLPL